MPVPDFAIDINLDGQSYPAARGSMGERQVAVTYVPKVKSDRINAIGQATLDPVEYTTFHKGGGASRNVGIDGMVAYGENIWTGDPGILMPGPEVAGFTLSGATVSPRPDGIAEADGHIFVAAGRYVFRLSNGQVASPTPSQDLDTTASYQANSLRRFGSSVFATSTSVATGAGTNLWERPDGGAWTNVRLGATDVTPNGALGRVWWTTGGITSERLVAQFGSRGIRYCATSPRLDTSWTPGLASPAVDMGGEGLIQRFVTTLTHLYTAATAGLMDLDQSGLAPNLVPEAEVTRFSTNGLAVLPADGFIYYSYGFDLMRVSVSGTGYAQREVVTPMLKLPNETPFGGYGTSLVKYGVWLIYCQYDPVNDTSWISWGREALDSEIGPIVWNVAPIVIHGWKVTAMHISGLSADGPRLYLFGTTLGGSVSGRWAPLPYSTPYGDLKANRARRFSQTAYVVLPAEDGGDDSIPKDIEEILNENENMGSGNSITVSARKEGENAFTQLAKFVSGTRITAPIRAAFVSLRPQFRIDMVGTPLSPPISRRLSVRWLPNPDVREVRRYMLKIGRYEQYGGGNWSFVGADEQLARLIRLATTAARVNMTDEANNALIVRVLKIEGPAEFEGPSANDRVLVVALTLSVFGAQPGPPFGYDAGVGWDTGHSWS